MTWNDPDITPAILLGHMQSMERSINVRFDGVEERLDRVEKRLTHVEVQLVDLTDHKRWVESHDLPRRVSRLEDKVFAGVDTK